MDAKDRNPYKACDRAIKAMNRDSLKDFGMLKLLKSDQVNIIQAVTETYRRSRRKAVQQYYEVAFESYLLGLMMSGIDTVVAHWEAEKAITREWIEKVLQEIDFVTLYSFDAEMERKAQKLAEILIAADGKPGAGIIGRGAETGRPVVDRNTQIDRALKEWSRQLGQYAINFTDYAITQAMDDAGIKKAMWVTEQDERVCHDCRVLDGRIFLLDEFPPKPHLGCRCRRVPVLDEE